MTRYQAIFRERIVRDPAILTGKPVIKGTRIPIELILMRLAENPDLTELFAAYPRLTVEDVRATLAYAGTVVEGQATLPTRRAERLAARASQG